MTAVAIVALQVIGCLGFGTLTLRLTGIHNTLSVGERYTWSFAIGLGVLGWVLFFVGVLNAFSSAVLLAVVVAPAPAALLVRQTFPLRRIADEVRGASRIVVGAVILIIAMDAFEVPAPVTDADSIAYHVDLVRRFWEAGQISFVPRALDGAVPLLVQMTYIVPYAFGGETALNLWTMVSGLAASLLVYVTSRRYLTASWSFGIMAVFATTPAVLYGAGSGQVEIRLALFVLVAVMAAGAALKRKEPGFVIVAGLAAGFFMGGKYFGLLFAFATGVALLCQSGFLKRGALYSVFVLLAGFQWYWWNWLHAADPVFPMLFPLFGDGGTGYWSQTNHDALQNLFSNAERAVPADIFWFFAYPFSATLRSYPVFESVLTGFGPFILLILPFALAGVWHFRREIRMGPLTVGAISVLGTYALWFFLASSQRVRYILPIYPVLLIIVAVAAIRFVEKARLVKPVVAALILTCLIQLAGQALFTARYVRFAVTDQDREAFLTEGVGKYAAVKWVNEHLDRDAYVMTPYREMMFLLKPRVFQAHTFDQSIVDVLPQNDDVQLFVRQVRAERITHAIAAETPEGYEASYSKMMTAATAAGCFKTLGEVEIVSRGSRTLPMLSQTRGAVRILERTDKTCPW